MIKIFYKKTEKLTAQEQSHAAHALLREQLALFYGVDEALLVIEKDSRGAPFVSCLPQVFVSITHTDGMVACAFADSPVGVDAEKIKMRRKTVEKRVFTDGEISLIASSKESDRVFFGLWTLKESYLKALGTGFADNAKSIEFSSVEPEVISDRKNCKFTLKNIDGYAVAVCTIYNDKIENKE